MLTKQKKVEQLKKDLELHDNKIRDGQKVDDTRFFKDLLFKELYNLEDKEGNPLRKNYDDDFWKGYRKCLHDLINKIDNEFKHE